MWKYFNYSIFVSPQQPVSPGSISNTLIDITTAALQFILLIIGKHKAFKNYRRHFEGEDFDEEQKKEKFLFIYLPQIAYIWKGFQYLKFELVWKIRKPRKRRLAACSLVYMNENIISTCLVEEGGYVHWGCYTMGYENFAEFNERYAT